jgi:signal-transduction protein with cAMP-binding, CBS, and nucleotidyltransferase domain
MKENLKQTLSFGGVLNRDEIEQIAGAFELRKFRPGDRFLYQNKRSSELAFVDQGIMRTYITWRQRCILYAVINSRWIYRAFTRTCRLL